MQFDLIKKIVLKIFYAVNEKIMSSRDEQLDIYLKTVKLLIYVLCFQLFLNKDKCPDTIM